MALHPQIAEALRHLPGPPEGPLDPVAMRAADAAHVTPPADRLALHAVVDIAVDTAAGQVPVRVYTPQNTPSAGVIVYLHGGAFFLGSLDTHDHVARSLAKESHCTVVSVGYRLAPEACFPGGLDDCYAVLRWVAEQDDRLAGAGGILAVAGDSSGGTFAAAVAAMAHDAGFEGITHQVLYYPSLDLDFDVERYPSLRENATGYGMETAGLKPFNAFYLASGADPEDPLVSPIKRADLSGLPRALIITAEHDPLRDEGERYGQRLRDAGVQVTVHRYPGATHGFVQHFSWIPEYHQVFQETGAFVNGADAPAPAAVDE
jgi:acetyl esterase